MKILLLSRYGRLGASSRLRSYQYLPYLKEHNIEVTVAPLLGDSYVQNMYSGGRTNPSEVAKSYFNRVKHILNADSFDALWVEKEFFPWLPAVVPQTVEVPYLVDYDDALFHRYDTHSSRFIRRVLGSKIDTVMENASMVTVGNEYLAKRARNAGATRIEQLPTTVNLDRYSVRKHSNKGQFTVGWIGSPSTVEYLQIVQPSLAKLLSDGEGRLVLIGSGEVSFDDIPTEVREWSEETEVSDIKSLDVGIMPLPDRPWERGKCGYKLIQYMACGVPVVASPVGVNQTIVEEGHNGFLAESQSEWIKAIEYLRDKPTLREQLGHAGREKVEKRYSLSVTAPKLQELLKLTSELQ